MNRVKASLLVVLFLLLFLVTCTNNLQAPPTAPIENEANEATQSNTNLTSSPVEAPVLVSNSAQAQPSQECPSGDPEAYLLEQLETAVPQNNESPTVAFDAFNREVMQPFLQNNCYAAWARDKTIRDTGPFIENQDYGTHPAVVLFYSPKAVTWLEAGRDTEIEDGAVIVKVQFAAPAAQYEGEMPGFDSNNFYGWSIGIRYQSLSKDGWYWGGYDLNPQPDLNAFPNSEYPYGGIGQLNACMRCHAVADDDAYVFADLRNIEGFPGEQLTYVVDDSWQTPVPTSMPAPTATPLPTRQPNPAFLATFNQLDPVPANEVVAFPNIIYDTVVSGHDGPEQFLTSNQCTTCHGGLSGRPFGPLMVVPPENYEEAVDNAAHEPGSGHSSLRDSLGNEGINVSPSGEWHWSMMGLAGRDPIFFSQLESEMNLHNEHGIPEIVQDTCLRCHGVMGQRQFHIDQADDPEARFTKEHVYNLDKYGGLARDGISCMVCHQIADEGELIDIDTGRFIVPPVADGMLQVNGPYDDPNPFPMISGLGIEPVGNEYIQSSQVCQSCHTIRLPVFDADNNLLVTDDAEATTFQLFEQTTYLEWVNSDFASGDTAMSCQDCHMPQTLNGEPLEFKIAAIQDQDYPYSDTAVSIAARTVNPRKEFSRHSLHGINLFALEMFNQFSDILGVSKNDYMTGNKHDLDFAIADYNLSATKETAVLTVSEPEIVDGNLVVDVSVSNQTGHRFPSGVGFRRAFINFNVIDERGNVVWSSGNTNSLGIIVGPDGEPLPTEFLPDADSFQPHYQTISSQDQVQIYEELILDPQGEFTTSFISRCQPQKDNRLLATGWSDEPSNNFPDYDASENSPSFGDVPTISNSEYNCKVETSFEATLPEASVREEDPDYAPGSNTDTIRYQISLDELAGEVNESWHVEATLYYQATPPYFLQDRFEAGRTGGGEEIMESQRLHYLASHLDVANTPIDNWRLLIASDSKSLPSETENEDSSANAANWQTIFLALPFIFATIFVTAKSKSKSR